MLRRRFRDQEVFDFVRDHLHLVGNPSLRLYVLAAQQKAAGLDWKSQVLDRCLAGAAREVARLGADPSFSCEEERVRAFVESGAGCRSTYFNHAKRLAPPGEVPDIVSVRPRAPGLSGRPGSAGLCEPLL